MKYLYITCLFFLSCVLFSVAQTPSELEQAKVDYRNKDYAKALPVIEKAYNAKPADASLNLWYGVCLLETGGDAQKAESCLLAASKKNQPTALLYLGDWYVKNYRLADAEDLYGRYAKARPKDKATDLESRNETLTRMKRFVLRTEDIQIIDSLIVDKADFLSAYKLSADEGTLAPFAHVFKSNYPVESVVYANAKGSKIYFGQAIEGRYVLSTMDKLLNGFGNEKLMSDDSFGLTGDVNYPYVLSDGITAYFAGKDENGMGGYDIYVTRYNMSNDSYLSPEMLNMPFNSPANDYMMVVDEIKGVGWFATDRFQPEGKVCVYTFIPNETVTLLESGDDGYRENRARISSLKDTWKAGTDYSALVASARRASVKPVAKTVDFTFVVDDAHTYHSYSDFKNTSARNSFFDLNKKKKDLETLVRELDNLRNEYSQSTQGRRNSLSGKILEMESRQEKLSQEILAAEKNIRNTEIAAYSK
jgi:tetratricopeptide (TPR) repeat protein